MVATPGAALHGHGAARGLLRRDLHGRGADRRRQRARRHAGHRPLDHAHGGAIFPGRGAAVGVQPVPVRFPAAADALRLPAWRCTTPCTPAGMRAWKTTASSASARASRWARTMSGPMAGSCAAYSWSGAMATRKMSSRHSRAGWSPPADGKRLLLELTDGLIVSDLADGRVRLLNFALGPHQRGLHRRAAAVSRPRRSGARTDAARALAQTGCRRTRN